MKKLTYLVLLAVSCLCTSNSVAQSFSVPSPSASQMTRYGGSSINESSGRVTTSIPVYNYNAGNLSVPIGLNYVGNGVKIDQHSNWVGTNWLLNSGGVITRVVNHIADETATNRLYFSDIESSLSTNSSYTAGLLNGTNLTDDLRPDLFSFSFQGYSGSFYIDPNGLPKLMVIDSELKIELEGGISGFTTSKTIKITTPTGVQYYFGGDNASESTSTIIRKPNVIGSGSGGGVILQKTGATTSNKQTGSGSGTPVVTPPDEIDYTVIPKSITAFYLYKIVHPFGDIINIDYHDDGDKEYTMFQGDYLEKIKSDNYNNISEACSLQFFGNTDNTTIQRSVYKGKIYNRKKISRIHSLNSNYEVRFLSTNLTLDPDGDGEIPVQYDDRVLNSIEVHNNQIAEVTKKIDLEYITTDHRIFLEKVKTKNNVTSSVSCSVYKMMYDAPESLPARFSAAQDLLGYYNNQLQNTTTLPVNLRAPEFTGVFSNLANRSLDFNYVKKGSLTRIYNPTGGFTQFEYEAPKVKAIANLSHYDVISGQVSAGNSLVKEFYIGNVPEGKQGTVVAGQKWYRVHTSIRSTTAFLKKAIPRIRVKLIRTSDNTTVFEDYVYGIEGASQNSKSFDIWTGANNYDYKFEFTLMGNSLSANITANIGMSYIGYKNVDAYGIRVKKVSDFAASNSSPVVKRFYYTRIEKALTGEEDEESAVITYEPENYFSGTFSSSCCPTLQGSSVYSYVSLNSNPFGYFFAGADNQASYKYVTTSFGGDHFEQGGVENNYRVELNEKPIVEYIPENGSAGLNSANIFLGGFTNNKSILNGTLLNTTNYKNIGSNNVVKINETTYTYSILPLFETTGLILSSNTRNCLINTSKPIIAYYKNSSYDFNLTVVDSKTFIETLPTPTEIGTFISKKKEFEYGLLQGLPTKITSSSSVNDKKNILKNYYLTSSEISAINTLINPLSPQEENAYTSLITQKRTSSPIQTESYIKKGAATEELRATQRTTFKDFGGLILPEHSKTSKMSLPIVTRSTNHKYDSNGAILEMSSDNNVRSTVIYGYKDKKIIAKLVNVGLINPVLLENIHTAANAVTNTATMNALEVQLDLLRATYPAIQINTYIYNWLGQLTKTKDARGSEVRYEYDDCYRLEYVKDSNGNIIQKHQYKVINN